MPRYVTKKRLAEACDVSLPRISTLCKGRLAPAVARDGTVDVDHPDVADYLRSRNASDEALGLMGPATSEAAPPPAVPDDIEGYADLTLRELVDRFGTDERFETWLKSVKLIADIEDRRIKNATSKGQLVSRDLVERYVFGVIDETNARLLNDSPKTIAGQVRAAVKAGKETEEIEAMVRDLISAQLKNVKRKATRGLSSD